MKTKKISNLNEFYYGLEAAANLKSFHSEIAALNDKYKHELEERDNVERHMFFEYYGVAGFANFGFNDLPELPPFVRTDMAAIFRKHFPVNQRTN